MFADHITTALSTARGRALDDVSRVIWKGLAEGLLSDDEAQTFAEQLHARRMAEGAVRASQAATGGQGRPRSIFPPRRVQRAPDRAVARARRRDLSLVSAMPHAIAKRFTEGERAVLTIVAGEVRAHGACMATLAEIAARAGVCRKLAQTTLRLAERLGLVAIEERRRRGQKNLPNVVRIIAREWRAWIEARPKEGIGGKRIAPTGGKISPKREVRGKNGTYHHEQSRGMHRPHERGR